MRVDILAWGLGGRGGIEQVILKVDREMERRGVDVRVILSGDTSDRTWESELENPVHLEGAVPERSHWAKRYSPHELQLVRYKAFYEEHGLPDAIFVAIIGIEPWVRLAVGEGRGKPVILSWPHVPINGVESNPFLYSDGLLAISETMTVQSKRRNPELEVHWTGNPVDVAVPEVERAQEPTFIFMGRLDTEKRVDWIVRAASALKGKRFKIKIFGSGQLETMLRSLAKQLGVEDKLEWMGYQPDAWDMVQAATALLLPSTFEGFGMVIAESLARGLPVIASDCPIGPADLIQDGVNGYLFGVEDYDSFVELLADCVEGSLPLPDSETCKMSVQQYATELVVDRMLNAASTISKIE